MDTAEETARKRRRTSEDRRVEDPTSEDEDNIAEINRLRESLQTMQQSLEQFYTNQTRQFGKLRKMLHEMDSIEYRKKRRRMAKMQDKMRRSRTSSNGQNHAMERGIKHQPQEPILSDPGLNRECDEEGANGPAAPAPLFKPSFLSFCEDYELPSTQDLPPYSPEPGGDAREDTDERSGYTPPVSPTFVQAQGRSAPELQASTLRPSGKRISAEENRRQKSQKLAHPQPSSRPLVSPGSPLHSTGRRSKIQNSITSEPDFRMVKREPSDDNNIIPDNTQLRKLEPNNLILTNDRNLSATPCPQAPRIKTARAKPTVLAEDPSPDTHPSTPQRANHVGDSDEELTTTARQRRNLRTKSPPVYDLRKLTAQSFDGELESNSQITQLERILQKEDQSEQDYKPSSSVERAMGVSPLKRKRGKPPKKNVTPEVNSAAAFTTPDTQRNKGWTSAMLGFGTQKTPVKKTQGTLDGFFKNNGTPKEGQ